MFVRGGLFRGARRTLSGPGSGSAGRHEPRVLRLLSARRLRRRFPEQENHHLACQFTFACEGKNVSRIDEPDMWEQAKEIAKKMLDGKIWLADIGHATHYHAYWVHPSWVHEMVRSISSASTLSIGRAPGAMTSRPGVRPRSRTRPKPRSRKPRRQTRRLLPSRPEPTRTAAKGPQAAASPVEARAWDGEALIVVARSGATNRSLS